MVRDHQLAPLPSSDADGTQLYRDQQEASQRRRAIYRQNYQLNFGFTGSGVRERSSCEDPRRRQSELAACARQLFCDDDGGTQQQTRGRSPQPSTDVERQDPVP